MFVTVASEVIALALRFHMFIPFNAELPNKQKKKKKKAKGEQFPNLGQIAGEGIAFSMMNPVPFPVVVLQMRGRYLTFGVVYASNDPCSGLRAGRPNIGPAGLHLFEPENNQDKGYNLLEHNQRDLAFRMLGNVMAVAALPVSKRAVLQFPVTGIAKEAFRQKKKANTEYNPSS